jgi:hypothetical protein
MKNPSQAIQVGYRQLAGSGAFQDFTPAQQALIQQGAKTGLAVRGLELAGSGLSAIGMGLTGGAEGGAAGLVMGVPFRAAAKALQGRAGSQLSESLSKGVLDRFPDYTGPAPAPSSPLQITGPGATMYGDAMGNVGRTPNLAQEVTNPQASRPIVGDTSPSPAPPPAAPLMLSGPDKIGLPPMTDIQISQARARAAAMGQGTQPQIQGGAIPIQPPKLLAAPGNMSALPEDISQQNAQAKIGNSVRGNDGQLPPETIPVYPKNATTGGMIGNMGAKTLGQIKALALQGKTPEEIADYLQRMKKGSQ